MAPYEGLRKDCCIYVLFSCYAVCIFIGKKKQNLGVGEGVERDKSRGTGGPNSSGRLQGTPAKIIDGGLVS